MTDWLYLMTVHADFPDPLAEIAMLAAVAETGDDDVLLPLADRAHPPMSGAEPGDGVLLCTRDRSGLLAKHAVARVAARPTRREAVPASLQALYPAARNRWFVSLTDLRVVPTEPVSELTLDEQRTMASGQAFVRRLGRPITPSRVPAVRPVATCEAHAVPPSPVAGPSATVIGLDPTAGVWPSMAHGPKPMPSVALRILADGTLTLHEAGVVWHGSNDDFWRHLDALGPSVTCIDGPCATAGPRILPDWSGWDPAAPDGVRVCERDLTKLGIALFWTTRATVFGFPGASRWIARALRLFHEAAAGRGGTVIETHPYGVFLTLWRAAGHAGPLPRKTTPEGRARRVELLRHAIPTFEGSMLRDHDAVDAVAAAVLAACYVRGKVTGYGMADTGGTIWLPDESAPRRCGADPE